MEVEICVYVEGQTQCFPTLTSNRAYRVRTISGEVILTVSTGGFVTLKPCLGLPGGQLYSFLEWSEGKRSTPSASRRS